MEQLRVPNLLGGALAAVSGAVVASLFGIFGTLAGAAVMSILMAVATAGYAHSLAAAHRWLRCLLLRRAAGEADAAAPPAPPICWQRVAVAAAVVFALAMGAVTTVEAAAGRPLASLLGRRSRQGRARRSTWSSGRRAGRRCGLRRLRAPPPPRRRPGRRRPRRRSGGHHGRAAGSGSQHHGPRCDADHQSRRAGSYDPAALSWRSRTASGSARADATRTHNG